MHVRVLAACVRVRLRVCVCACVVGLGVQRALAPVEIVGELFLGAAE